MISLQKLFGKDDLFFSLLEASAAQGRNSIHGLNQTTFRSAGCQLTSFV
jgi:hypothetical protein